MRKLRALPASVPKDKDRLLPLIQETVEEGGSVLVFCGGRAQTQSTAGMTADNLAPSRVLPARFPLIVAYQCISRVLSSMSYRILLTVPIKLPCG